MKDNIEDLKWVRIFDPIHIPKYLIDQIKSKEFSTEDFYKFQSFSCLIKENNSVSLNPVNHLYVLVDSGNIVKGFVWFTIDVLSKDLCLNTFSIDKKYWFKGRAVKKVSEFIKYIKNKAKLNKVFWITNYPKHSEKYGFKRSKHILMEYSEEKDGKNINRRNDEATEHRAINTTTKEFSK